MSGISFASVWEGIAAELPGAIAIAEPEGTVSYAEFDDRASRLAAVLREAGAGPGSKVACYLFNGRRYLETVFAAFKLGAVPVNANYRYRGAELSALLTDADTEVLVYAPELSDAVEVAAREVTTLRLALRADQEYERALAAADPLPHCPRPGTDQLFMYTGGTTGKPKGVIWAQADLLHAFAYATYGAMGWPTPADAAAAVATAAGMSAAGQRRISMPVVPLMHGTGLFNTFGTLVTAGEVVFPGGTRLDPARVWRSVADHHVGSLLIAGNAIARPLVEELLTAERAGRPYDISSVSNIISSGTVFTDDLKAELHRRAAVTIYDGLAASEGGPFAFAVTASADDLPGRFRPVPGAVVLGPDDTPLAPGSAATGVLAYRGALPLGYYKDPGRTAATYRVIDGARYVVVGDYVRYEADGTLDFLGRGSAVINTGGEKVYPGEIEQALLTHPGVRDAAVIGEPDPTWGERVAAVVSLRAGAGQEASDGQAAGEELREWLRPQLAGYKLPRRVVVVDDLPRTPTGKLEQSRVRALLGAASDAASGGVADTAAGGPSGAASDTARDLRSLPGQRPGTRRRRPIRLGLLQVGPARVQEVADRGAQRRHPGPVRR